MGLQQLVRLVLDPAGDRRVRGPAAGRIVFDSAVVRGIVRRSHDDAVGESARPAAIVAEDRVRHDGRRSESVAIVDHHFHIVRGENLERGRERRFRQRVRVDSHEQRTIDAVLLSIETDRLRDGEDVLLVERGLERCSAVTRRSERDALRGDGRIDLERVVHRHESRKVDEYGFGRRFSSQWADSHCRSFCVLTNTLKSRSTERHTIGHSLQAIAATRWLRQTR